MAPKRIPNHGSASEYRNHKCRCDACKQANTDYCREAAYKAGRRRPMEVWKAEVAARPIQHGTETAYKKGCRCRVCTRAASVARVVRRIGY